MTVQTPSENLSLRGLRFNNFDFLRWLFAVVVFLVHAHILSGSPQLSFLSEILSSDIAVKSFFVVSGFLIFMSFEKSGNMSSYFSKRVRRIYPAYFSIVVLCAVAGAVFTNIPISEYFSVEWLKYLLANLLFMNFLHPDLPGLFTSNPVGAVNGALWTLKLEVMFYICVPIFILAMRRWGRWQIILWIYVLSLTYLSLVEAWGIHTGSAIYPELQRQLPGQLAFFIAGAVLYYNFSDFQRYAKWLVVAAAVVLLVRHWVPVDWLEPMALAILVIYFACLFPYLGNFGKYGDFSYGIYIVHFPILQTLVQFGVFEHKPFLGLMIAGILTFITAYLFWHLIEKLFLRKNSHYVEANRG